MAHDRSLRRYRAWYGALLRLYPGSYCARFGEGMEQTFTDLVRERSEAGSGVLLYVFRIFVETVNAIIKENWRVMTVQHKNLVRVTCASVLLLLVPLAAMQFTDEVNWSPGDFAVAGVLLLSTGLAYVLLASRVNQLAYRAAVGVALAAGLLLVWMNLAVGIIGSESETANVMYVGVLAVGIVGVALARFEPKGMARALLATALAQALVAAVALGTGMHRYPGTSLSQVVNLNGFFVALFVISSLLFRRAVPADSK